MSQTQLYNCNTRNLRKILTTLLDAGLVPFITSSPGMGKSSIIKALARDYSLKLIDHRVSTSEPTDFSGLPYLKEDSAKMVPFTDIFPLDSMEIPKGYNGWLLFLDEFNSGTKQVQAASYRPVLDHQVGQHNLHPDCRIVLAGNKSTDRAIVNSLSTAMQSRVIHLELVLDFDIWFEDVAVAENYHPTVKAFLLNNKTRLMDFDPDHQNKTFCCPR